MFHHCEVNFVSFDWDRYRALIEWSLSQEEIGTV